MLFILDNISQSEQDKTSSEIDIYNKQQEQEERQHQQHEQSEFIKISSSNLQEEEENNDQQQNVSLEIKENINIELNNNSNILVLGNESLPSSPVTPIIDDCQLEVKVSSIQEEEEKENKNQDEDIEENIVKENEDEVVEKQEDQYINEEEDNNKDILLLPKLLVTSANNGQRRESNDSLNSNIIEIPTIITTNSSGVSHLEQQSSLQVSKDSQHPGTQRNENLRSTSVPLIRSRVQRTNRQKVSHGMNEKPLLHSVLVQEEIKTLFNYDDVNSKDSTGNSILHRASIIGSLYAVRMIVNRGGKVNSVNNSGMIPLHYAACTSVQCSDMLLYYGASINAKDVNNETPLYYAVDRGQISIVSLLLLRGPKVNINNKSMNRNPIHIAALKGYSGILKLLLDYKCNPNSLDCFSSTPLHLAVHHSPNPESSQSANTITQSHSMSSLGYNGSSLSYNNADQYLSCCELLLQRGSNLYIQDCQGSTPLHIAAKQGKRNLIDLLLFYTLKSKSIIPPPPPPNSINSSINLSASSELKNESILYIPDNKGRTALHLASLNGQNKIIELLLGSNKKVMNIKDDMGLTAICLASIYGHFETVEILNNIDLKHNQSQNYYYKFFTSSIDDPKTPFDPLHNDFKFSLDGDFCDLVFHIEGRDIYCHTILLRQFKCFREMISCQKIQQHNQSTFSQQFLGPNGCTNTNNGKNYQSNMYMNSYQSQYDNSYISHSQDSNFFMEDDFYFNGSYDGNGNGRLRARSRLDSIVNPSGLIRIPIEKGISYDVFRGLLHFVYTSEIPREIITTPGKLSELMDLSNQFDIDSLHGICVETLSQNSQGRYGTLDMAKYLYRQVGSKVSSDVTFITDQGYILQAHSVILAARCSFFKLHFEKYPVLSKSSISILNNNQQSGGQLSTSASSLMDNGSPIRKMSCPSSPALSDIPTLGWMIDISDVNLRTLTALLEYIYSGSIPSANLHNQSSTVYFTPLQKPQGEGPLDVMDLLVLSKLAYTLNLPTLQQYIVVLLFNILDANRVVSVLKSIIQLDQQQPSTHITGGNHSPLNNSQNGNNNTNNSNQYGDYASFNLSLNSYSSVWNKSPCFDQMWNICVEWMVKKQNWAELEKSSEFQKLGSKFIKEIKRERKEKKKKLKLTDKLIKKKKEELQKQEERDQKNSIKLKSRELFKSKSSMSLTNGPLQPTPQIINHNSYSTTITNYLLPSNNNNSTTNNNTNNNSGNLNSTTSDTLDNQLTPTNTTPSSNPNILHQRHKSTPSFSTTTMTTNTTTTTMTTNTTSNQVSEPPPTHHSKTLSRNNSENTLNSHSSNSTSSNPKKSIWEYAKSKLKKVTTRSKSFVI
ncbi:ankyrin repeat-containing protein [Tieghemostelium lacteum]|uniref:Ankyrin repeat-containing protein n=1 Tax=Tieghemostelium lacteum TaxID=361077 RepID=A0A151ZFG5_TIELA|nr:ankyrin repeat-containing protein [Tieghemostelium lacteum]|eukprot:KYQ92610.1 ankyrin repeat-containing protein [Tieghemostelium lacteum]